MGYHDGPPAIERHNASSRRRARQPVSTLYCLRDSLQTEAMACCTTTARPSNVEVHTVPAAVLRGRNKRRVPVRVFSALSLLATTAAIIMGAGGGLLDRVDAVTVPAAPARIALDVVSGDEVTVAFHAPLSDGGSAVQSYEVRFTIFSTTHSVKPIHPRQRYHSARVTPCFLIPHLERVSGFESRQSASKDDRSIKS